MTEAYMEAVVESDIEHRGNGSTALDREEKRKLTKTNDPRSVLVGSEIFGSPKRKAGYRLGSSWISAFLFVVLPTLCSFVYLMFIATPEYLTEFRVTVHSPASGKVGDVTSLLGLGGSSTQTNDGNAVVQYLQSRQAVDDLEASIGLKSRYKPISYDILSGVSPKASEEAFVEYWNSMISAHFDTSANTIIVKIYAFSAEDSLVIAQQAFKLSEKLINEISERSRHDMVNYVKAEVDLSENRLKDVLGKLRDLRDQQQMLDPKIAAATNAEIAGKIRQQISQANIELSAMKATLSDKAPSVIVARDRLKGLLAELDNLNNQLTSKTTTPASATNALSGANTTPDASASRNTPLSGVVGAFEQVENERTFAERAYQSSLVSLEEARLDAARQQVYLATIVRPALAQEATFPRPIKGTLIFFCLALSVWAIGMLIVHGVREHM